MQESPKRTRPAVRFAAAVLLVPVFVGGVWVGRTKFSRTPQVDTPWVWRDRQQKLSACQRRLARLEARAVASDAVAPPTVESLEASIEECRKRELLANAEMCSSVGRHLRLMKALPDDGELCREKAATREVLLDDFKKCDDFDGVPEHLSLADEEKRRIAEAVHLHETLTRADITEQLGDIHSTCLETAARKLARP